MDGGLGQHRGNKPPVTIRPHIPEQYPLWPSASRGGLLRTPAATVGLSTYPHVSPVLPKSWRPAMHFQQSGPFLALGDLWHIVVGCVSPGTEIPTSFSLLEHTCLSAQAATPCYHFQSAEGCPRFRSQSKTDQKASFYEWCYHRNDFEFPLSH